MNSSPRYYSKEVRPGQWQIFQLGCNVPLHDKAPYGKDKPLTFTDQDAVDYTVRMLNGETET